MTLPRPALGTRGTEGYRYAELFLALGPQAIGDTGENTLDDLIGRVWALVLTRERRLELYQRAADASTWTRVTELLPPLFEQAQPEGRRRFSIAFDQSSRAIVAYEEAETVYLTRWDTSENEYIQNVTIPGVDPITALDATWSYNVSDSDVLLFYLSPDRTRLLARIQRQLFAIEVELHDYGAPVVLDRVTRLPLRYQVLASDEAGDPLEDAGARVGLLSDLYPVPASETLAAFGAPDLARYELDTVVEEADNGLAGSAAPDVAVYIGDTAFRDGEDTFVGSSTADAVMVYISETALRAPDPDAIEGSSKTEPIFVYILATVIATTAPDALEGGARADTAVYKAT